jgi:Amt family ammonium transporter
MRASTEIEILLTSFPFPPMTPEALKMSVDTVWTILAGGLVFWMCAGFAMIEAGFSRSKHCLHVLAMNYAVVAVVALGFWAIGFGLMFSDGSPLAGLGGFFPTLTADTGFKALEWATIPLAAKFFFQLCFADTAATIVSGTVAERMKFSAYMIFSIFMVTVLYPVTGHWIWGGGFLSTLTVPFQDFAGSTAVHSVGGWAALLGAIMVGPRLGRFDAQGKPKPMRAHNMSMATLGALILWLGWFGFNAGSTMAADARVISHIVTTTMLAGAAGMTSAMFAARIWSRKADVGAILNGTLAGLVAITAGCNAVSMVGAIIIGLLAGVLCYAGGFLVERIHIDDPVGALPVHLMNGIWGTLAVGLFATKAGSVGAFDGLFYGGGMALLTSQVIGVACVGLFTAIGSAICWSIVKATVGLRVSPMVELEGLDEHEHGALAYIYMDDDSAPGDEIFGTGPQVISHTRMTEAVMK